MKEFMAQFEQLVNELENKLNEKRSAASAELYLQQPSNEKQAQNNLTAKKEGNAGRLELEKVVRKAMKEVGDLNALEKVCERYVELMYQPEVQQAILDIK